VAPLTKICLDCTGKIRARAVTRGLSFYVSGSTTPVASAPPLLIQEGSFSGAPLLNQEGLSGCEGVVSAKEGSFSGGSPPESGGAERKRRGVVSASAAVVSGGRFLAHANAQSQGTGGDPRHERPH
jgi:hypothetical protein